MPTVKWPGAFRKAGKALWMMGTHPKGFWHYCGDALSAGFRTDRILGKPVFITIEPTSACDLGCPVCETGAKVIDRPIGQMSLDKFKIVVDQVKHHTNAIQLYFMGESFLNRYIYDMVRYAKAQKIFVNIYSNGSVLDPARAVECGLDEINFNIGGMTQETHQTYRVNSNLERVQSNIKALVAAREQFFCHSQRNGRPRTPLISVGFIVMKHNEHEVEEFTRVVSTWGVDRVHVVDPCVRDVAQAMAMLPEERKYWFYDEEALKKGILRPKVLPNNRCNWVYFSTVITWNGNVVPCCRDPKGHHIMGNVFQEDFSRIWNGQRYRELRRQIRTDQKSVDICSLCSSFPVPALYSAPSEPLKG